MCFVFVTEKLLSIAKIHRARAFVTFKRPEALRPKTFMFVDESAPNAFHWLCRRKGETENGFE